MVFFNRKAFTLVELLVVISIIATLTAILLPNFMGARDRATDSQRKQDLVAMKNALRLFYNETQNYPPTGTNLGTTLAPFMPAVANIGFAYEYTQTPGGDGFTLSIVTESPNAQENGQSQLNCGFGVGETNATHYYVCAN